MPDSLVTPRFELESSKFHYLDAGNVMVVSDLHGNLPDFEQAIRQFNKRKAAREVQYLVFLGDLIHARTAEDNSVEIIERLILMEANKPGSHVFALMGNHEMVHVYHVELWKGHVCYTEEFEREIADRRARYIRFFMEMPFAIRTAGGVLLHHAGAGAIMGNRRHKEFGVSLNLLRHWPHEQLLQTIFAHPYLEDADPINELVPLAGDWFRETSEGEFLWNFFMNKNERHSPKNYPRHLKQFLKSMFKDLPVEGRTMVTGHIQVPLGVEIVENTQLRISSGYGAAVNDLKTVLLFSAGKVYQDAHELARGCRKLYVNNWLPLV